MPQPRYRLREGLGTEDGCRLERTVGGEFVCGCQPLATLRLDDRVLFSLNEYPSRDLRCRHTVRRPGDDAVGAQLIGVAFRSG